MRARLLVAASVAVLLGIGAWVTPASAATRCSKAGGTLAQTAGARVFVAQSNTLRRVFGCAAGQKNARSLGRAGGEGVDTKHLALVGSRVAYVLRPCSESGCSA
jgi:lauroyl/myristoyl acyltransferase